MMTRTLPAWTCAVLLVLTSGVALAVQKPIYESEAKTVTATIEAVDKASRVVTLKTEAGTRLQVTAPKEMEGFNSLKAGDLVSARYFEAVVVRLARPGSPAPSSEPTVRITRKDRAPGSEAMSERTVRATITAISKAPPLLTGKTADGLEHTMAVTDPAQLNGLKVGDVLDVTLYESRLVSVERPKK
jgi:Cu/Ag efflux protein CusF